MATVRPSGIGPVVLRLKRGEGSALAAGHLWVVSNEIYTERTPLVGFEAGALE
jgi:23S rRNA (cytosine1962-C5)-methyltransferase